MFYPLINLDGVNTSIKEKYKTQYENSITFMNIFQQNMLLAMERFHLENLPDGLNERVMLQSLLWYGNVCIFSPDKTNTAESLVALPSMPASNFNIYGDPVQAFVYGRNGMLTQSVDLKLPHGENKSVRLLTSGKEWTEEGHGVIIWENKDRYPFINQVFMYTRAMADCLRTIDVARRYVKVPVMVVASESAKVPTIKKAFEAVNTNEPIVVVSESLRDDDIQILPISTASEGAKTATELYTWYENYFLTLCGYNASNQLDKKGQNLLTAEVSINGERENANINKDVECIQSYLDIANDLFGTDMKVTTDYMNEDNEDETKEFNPDFDGMANGISGNKPGTVQ